MRHQRLVGILVATSAMGLAACDNEVRLHLSSLGGASGGGSHASGGGSGGARDAGDSGSGGVGGGSGRTTETGSDLSDANAVNMDANNAPDVQADVDYSRWNDWNAFWPLASGSAFDGSPGTTPDVSGHGYDATYGGGISFAKSAMVMSVGYVSIPPRSSVPAVDVTGSYSVSAWVTMTDLANYKTFVSADGSQVSAFYLQKRDDYHFAFSLPPWDTNTGALAPEICIASAALIIPTIGTQYHLVGTRDATTGLDTLYVNGVSSATATCPASWPASTFGIGYGMYNSVKTDYQSGSISNVGLIGRALTPDDVAALYALGPG